MLNAAKSMRTPKVDTGFSNTEIIGDLDELSGSRVQITVDGKMNAV